MLLPFMYSINISYFKLVILNWKTFIVNVIIYECREVILSILYIFQSDIQQIYILFLDLYFQLRIFKFYSRLFRSETNFAIEIFSDFSQNVFVHFDFICHLNILYLHICLVFYIIQWYYLLSTFRWYLWLRYFIMIIITFLIRIFFIS